MRKLVYFNSVSLDGFIDSTDKNLDWVIVNKEEKTFINDLQREFGAYLFGRRIYEMMQDYWPAADTPENPPEIVDYARIYRAKPKIVFSSTLDQVEGNARLVRGDAVEEVRRLKAEPGKDLEMSGSVLAGTLIRAGLVDEYQLLIQPVILGAGTRMLPALDRRDHLQLIETHAFTSGVVYLRYSVLQQPLA